MNIKSISRKARRFSTRNKQPNPAKFVQFDTSIKGHVLLPVSFFKKVG